MSLLHHIKPPQTVSGTAKNCQKPLPKLKLTDLAINSLAPGKTHWDLLLPAFGVRVGKHRKTFIIVTSKGNRIKLGTYPALTLQQARDQARKIISKAQTPLNSPASEPPTLTFAEALDQYLRTEGAKMGIPIGGKSSAYSPSITNHNSNKHPYQTSTPTH
jgi:hypothetical protein